jgi:ParB family transcriptional regulator, chromosome partitioning protein
MLNIEYIEIESLVKYREQLFRPYTGDRLLAMIKSIKERGVLQPIIVRQIGDNYEILSGHNRVIASMECNLTTIPAVIKAGITDLEAQLIVTETNLIQRSFTDMSHSEKSAVITARHSSLLRQGMRTDLIQEIEYLATYSSETRRRFRTDLTIGEEYGLSKSAISRYVRIAKLNVRLKNMLDIGSICLRTGVALSFLQEQEQEVVADSLEEGAIIDTCIAQKVREYTAEHTLQKDNFKRFLESTPKSRKLTLDNTTLSKYFTKEQSIDEIRSTIHRALEQYFR